MVERGVGTVWTLIHHYLYCIVDYNLINLNNAKHSIYARNTAQWLISEDYAEEMLQN